MIPAGGNKMTIQLEPIRPRRAQRGDLVGVVAPAGGAMSQEPILRGRDLLEQLGFRVLLTPGSIGKRGYLSSSESQRRNELLELFGNPEIKAIICLRGGYGSMHLLKHLDYGLIRANPKIFVGYSDITALHLAFARYTGLITFHGPMLASDLGTNPTTYTLEQFLRAIMSATPLGHIPSYPRQAPMVTISPGKARGILTGGNLTLVTSTLGTPFEIMTENKILFLEETGEAPYRIDRMLTHLRLAGKFQGLRGIIIGECIGCGSVREPEKVSVPSLEEVLYRCLGGLGIPCAYGLAAGHGKNHATLPLGVEVVLDADLGSLNILGQGVY